LTWFSDLSILKVEAEVSKMVGLGTGEAQASNEVEIREDLLKIRLSA